MSFLQWVDQTIPVGSTMQIDAFIGCACDARSNLRQRLQDQSAWLELMGQTNPNQRG